LLQRSKIAEANINSIQSLQFLAMMNTRAFGLCISRRDFTIIRKMMTSRRFYDRFPSCADYGRDRGSRNGLSERGIYFAAISPRWIDKREHYLCVNVIWKIWCSTMK